MVLDVSDVDGLALMVAKQRDTMPAAGQYLAEKLDRDGRTSVLKKGVGSKNQDIHARFALTLVAPRMMGAGAICRYRFAHEGEEWSTHGTLDSQCVAGCSR